MPTELKETVHPMAKHSSKWQRSFAAAIVSDARKRDESTNNWRARRAKNIADAKARDLKIKERAAEKERLSKANGQRPIKPVFEAT